MAASMMKMVLSFAAAFGLALMGGGPAMAGPPRPSDPVGIDVSWPQCGKTLPTGLAFAIVGVNNGLANTTNPCFQEQLSWAESTVSQQQLTTQPRVALYVNTANPGLAGSWWPTSNEYMGTTVTSSYGKCEGKNDAACAYVYGYAKAYDDATLRGVDRPEDYFWWLDVETGNSWQSDTTANRADLEGMTAYFESINAGVGIYSTGSQWSKIAGTVPSTSNLAGLPSWLAGARTLNGAKSNCSLAGLTPGSKVAVTQYVSSGLDYNYACK
ncbi:hypothetical protein ASF98_14660 [Arthrobacter sp. Leaf337]|uniref:hypothetical protein n=1 Tax=Arthrobacter sp. Leaf337 TaxID=1736342 RepID=UPI0006FCC463|nr:hypothetical protein [Arthrobacter sp. Leaf337]KQR62813.1 hypothetical protein ASF98_14660 [Arthrobacter sp. Leaf337]